MLWALIWPAAVFHGADAVIAEGLWAVLYVPLAILAIVKYYQHKRRMRVLAALPPERMVIKMTSLDGVYTARHKR
jgi:hypothetical protein